MVLRFLYSFFGLFFVECVVEAGYGYPETFLKKSINRHFVRTSNFPKIGDRFMVSDTLIATVYKVNHVHQSVVFGVQCFFKITEEK